MRSLLSALLGVCLHHDTVAVKSSLRRRRILKGGHDNPGERELESVFDLKKEPPTNSKCGDQLYQDDNRCGPPDSAMPAPFPTSTPSPTSNPASNRVRSSSCVQSSSDLLEIKDSSRNEIGELYCVDGGFRFGLLPDRSFGFFHDLEAKWTEPAASYGVYWVFQSDGNLVVRDSDGSSLWSTKTHQNYGSRMQMTNERVWIESADGVVLWEEPTPNSGPPDSPLPTSSPTLSPSPISNPTHIPGEPLSCIESSSDIVEIKKSTRNEIGEVYCVDGGFTFGLQPDGTFGFYHDSDAKWIEPDASDGVYWIFQGDGNLVVRDSDGSSLWKSRTHNNDGSRMQMTNEKVWIESVDGVVLWEAPPPHSPMPTPSPTSNPTPIPVDPLSCIESSSDIVEIKKNSRNEIGEVYCVDGGFSFGLQLDGTFGFYEDSVLKWTEPDASDGVYWVFQGDGNLVVRDSDGNSLWKSRTHNNDGSRMQMTKERVWIESVDGVVLWQAPPAETDYPDPDGALQYYAYYYPWYHRDNWSRHGYQDTPLLGLYGTDEVPVAEQHIEWALQTGISSFIVSWWGEDSLAMRHFKLGMMNASNLNKIKFCMLYETKILDDRGNWYDGSKEDSLFEDLQIVRDEFFDHPSYLKINGRPVIIFYITRSRMKWQDGFEPEVLDRLRERLDRDIYFIADEPFFNSFNDDPDDNENAIVDGKQVFDAYTTYNMYVDSRVEEGETATDYQLREAMPIWERWAEKVSFFPNVMAQYYDFRGHEPLVGNSEDFEEQLREVACLPRTNFNGAPHIMFITSFNEWWEGTQIEPENGSPDNWRNYGFDFINTLAAFKNDVDANGLYWC
eukprot:scaffold713_cov131-Cylindrotheca_fusiformis.AAC.15